MEGIALLASAAALLIVLRIVYLARDGIRWAIDALLRISAGCVLAWALLTAAHQDQQMIMVGTGVGGLAGIATVKRRSRHMPSSVRRAVIARDLKGEKFDSRKHHVDHVWPYSRGGSHTSDNLRVIEKRENLRKGARKPRVRDLFF